MNPEQRRARRGERDGETADGATEDEGARRRRPKRRRRSRNRRRHERGGRARASRRRKMEELAAAAPSRPPRKPKPPRRRKHRRRRRPRWRARPGGRAVQVSLFDDGAFEEALKGVNDVAAGLETASGGGGPSIDWGGVAAARCSARTTPSPASAISARDGDGGVDAEDRRGGDGVQRRGRLSRRRRRRPVPALAAAAPPPERQTEQVRRSLPGRRSAPG